jgi:predicted metalloprotease with PDZ domain
VKSQLASEQYGLKIIYAKGQAKIINVNESSAAYLVGISRGDIIKSINNFPLNNDLDKWLAYYENDKIILTVLRNGKLNNIELGKANENQFWSYKLEEIKN